jgi:general secretion pathway protein G
VLAAVCLAAGAALVYLVACARFRGGPFSLTDALMLIAIMAIVTATAIPLIDAVRGRAQAAVLRENLSTLRSQIALYQAQHGGQVPLLFEGMLPQLSQPTNSEGVPGPSGTKHPFGPYLPTGMPVNPLTGRSTIVATDIFPPVAASGMGGWLYHQPTGGIAADLPEYFQE